MPISPTIQFGTLILRDTGDTFVLDAPFVVTIKYEAILTAPFDMETDGASIPRFFWRLIGPPLTGKYRQAAVIHDAGYIGELEWKQIPGGRIRKYTRKEIDKLFLRLMKALKVPLWRRQLMYRAVRWFGGSHWTER